MDVEKYLKKVFSLEGKVILFTGAGGGIGRELCKAMAAAGGMLALADINQESIDSLRAEIEADGGTALDVKTDMGNLDDIKNCVAAVMARFGKIDVLVNCAGINKREGCLYATPETFDRIVNINLKGAYFITQEVAKHMIAAGTGSIINISSHNATMMLGGCGIYGATKSGISALTRAQAVEWAKYGIRSNAIAPGHFLTPLTEPTWTSPDRSKYLLDRIAMNRPGYPEDLVGMTLLLASDASAYMTGLTYPIDGGFIAGGQPWDIT